MAKVLKVTTKYSSGQLAKTRVRRTNEPGLIELLVPATFDTSVLSVKVRDPLASPPTVWFPLGPISQEAVRRRSNIRFNIPMNSVQPYRFRFTGKNDGEVSLKVFLDTGSELSCGTRKQLQIL